MSNLVHLPNPARVERDQKRAFHAELGVSAKLSNGWNIVTNWSAADCVRVTGELLKCGRDPWEFSVDYDRAKPKKS